MGRRRQAAERHSRAVEDPFPSSPTKPPKYTLYFTSKEGAIYTPGFRTAFGAKKAVDYILEQESWEWVAKDKIVTSSGIEIKSGELEEIIEYSWLNQAEAEWELPAPYPRELDRIRGIKYDPRVSEESQREADSKGRTGSGRRRKPDDDGASSKSDDAGGASEKQSRRGKTEERGGTDRRKTAGLVTLQIIAEELGIDPRKARAALRGKVDKPAGGWSWPASEVDAIKKLLK